MDDADVKDGYADVKHEIELFRKPLLVLLLLKNGPK